MLVMTFVMGALGSGTAALLMGAYALKRRNSGLGPVAAAFALGAVASVLLAGLAIENERRYWDGVELNPRFTSADLVGVWQRDQDRLILAPDGGAVLPHGTKGPWRLEEPSTVEAAGSPWAVITRHGRLQLVPVRGRFTDPDEWNLRSVYTRPDAGRP